MTEIDKFTQKGNCRIGNLDGAQDTTRLCDWFSKSRSDFTKISKESDESEDNSILENIVDLLDFKS